MEPISKKDSKIDKIHRKRLIIQQENSEYSQNLSEDKKILNKEDTNNEEFLDSETQYLYQLSRIKRAQQWWQQLDETYFKPLNRKNILLTRDLTSGERLINFYNLQLQLSGLFEDQEIYQRFPLLLQKTLVHVLFRSCSPFRIELVTYSFANYVQCPNRRPAKSVKGEQNFESIPMEDIKITSMIKKLKGHNSPVQNSQQLLEQVMKIGNLQWQAILQDDISICKFEKTMQTKNHMEFSEEINVQLKLWQNEIDQQSTQNSILWNNLISKSEKTIEVQNQDFSKQIVSIKSNLMHSTILRYIVHGTKDKTYEMVYQLQESMRQLKPAKTRQATSKKFFQTDCKICFCSFNSDSNQVLYCDMCNTSFHLACYGLSEVPQDKEYFCDRCTAIKKDQKTKNNIRKIMCQICCKPNFPIKQIGGHYYHMTCLILLNFITIREGRFELRQGMSHQKILNQVIQNQLQCQACIFCTGYQGAELGMQLRCEFKGCESSMHPICAYINGCEFELAKDMIQKRIQAKVFCNLHDCSRDYIQQTYLRRYMCNFKNTSQKTFQSFRSDYQTETHARLSKLSTSNPSTLRLPKLIFDSKVIRRHISLREPKPVSKQEETPCTEIGKILEKFQRPKNKG